MSAPRRVIVATDNKPPGIAKSQSANINPNLYQLYTGALNQPVRATGSQSGAIEPMANEQLAESNLLSEQPTKMVNQAYYTYLDPDNLNANESNKMEENDQYVIESMQKKNEMIQKRRREQDLKRVQYKMKVQKGVSPKEKKAVQFKLSSKQQATKSISTKAHKYGTYKNSDSRNKCSRQFCKELEDDEQSREFVHKNVLNLDNLKPAPLKYRVDMLGKTSLRSPRRNNNLEEEDLRAINEKPRIEKSLSPQVQVSESLTANENLNSRRLPFRFCGFS